MELMEGANSSCLYKPNIVMEIRKYFLQKLNLIYQQLIYCHNLNIFTVSPISIHFLLEVFNLSNYEIIKFS